MINLIRKILSYQVFFLSLSISACGMPMPSEGDADAADAADAADTKEATADSGNTEADATATPCTSGCFLGSTCVAASPEQCGLNSACIRCPAATNECQAATCTEGRCGIVNVADGVGCGGGVCRSGSCVRCGGQDDRCCQTATGSSCNPGGICIISGSFNMCTGCGGVGQPCCGGVGTIVRDDGGPARPVGYGGTCNTGFSCNGGGLCQCGQLGQPCCAGSVCNAGRCNTQGVCGV